MKMQAYTQNLFWIARNTIIIEGRHLSILYRDLKIHQAGITRDLEMDLNAVSLHWFSWRDEPGSKQAERKTTRHIKLWQIFLDLIIKIMHSTRKLKEIVVDDRDMYLIIKQRSVKSQSI